MKRYLFAAVAALGLSACATYDDPYYRDYSYSTCPRGYYPTGTGRCSSMYQGKRYRSLDYYDRYDYGRRGNDWYDDRRDNRGDRDGYDDEHDRSDSDWYDQRRNGRGDESSRSEGRSDYWQQRRARPERNRNEHADDDREYREVERRQQRRGSNDSRTVERRRDRDPD